MSPSQDAILLEALDRHVRRRTEGLATPSLLVGDVDHAWAVWRTWLHRRGRCAVLVESWEAREQVSAWALALVGSRDVMGDAERYVGLGQPRGSGHAPRFAGKTAHERRVLWDGLVPPAATPGAWELCHQLLEAAEPGSPGVLPTPLREAIAREPVTALQALAALVPAAELPALGFRGGRDCFPGLRSLTTLCQAVPALTVACVLAPADLAELERRGESRVLALLREGRLDVEAARDEGRERARSKPEWHLYQMLQHRPPTAGLFALNARVEGWEVDLLCPELKLAVEIDGYFHFQEPAAFRRDRRKDVALQLAGYLVVRVLADDVATRLDALLVELDTVITARRNGPSGQEPPHAKHR